MSRQYFVYLNDEISGPYSPEAIREWGLAPDTQVCAAGTEEWRLLSETPELLPAPDAATALASPFVAPPALTDRKKIFIIHGRGNTMDDAFGRLVDLLRVKFRYYQAGFYVDAENSGFTRYLLYETQENPWLALFDKVLVGKLAIAPSFPPPGDWAPDQTWTLLSEKKVGDKMNLHNAPLMGNARRAWGDQLFAAIWQEAASLLGRNIDSQPAFAAAMHELRMSLRPTVDGLYLEPEYREAIRSYFTPLGRDPEAFIIALMELQRLNDAGGDLDTIASNALYGAWLMQSWEATHGSPPLYGRDYAFDFVNYHQSFMHLARHAGCEVYLPDFPAEAIPDLEAAARALLATGGHLVRFDDHHPLAQDRLDLLYRLKDEGLIGDIDQSGGIKGKPEPPPEERTCGADLVHRHMLAGTPFDNPGLDELRRLAHQQDLHFVADPDDREHPDYLAIDLSKLLGSKYSRIDMVQQLMKVRSYEEMRQIMFTTGWRQVVDDYETVLEESLPKLDACTAMIEFYTPDEYQQAGKMVGVLGMLGRLLRAITFKFFDLEGMLLRMKKPVPLHRICVALAPFQSRKEHRINVASALNYSKRHFRFDYFFYAWGSSLLSTRRYNEEDQFLNLSQLMPIIGGPGDGGHPSAATCKPPSNARWPKEQFDRLSAKNFLPYCQYIAGLIAAGVGARIVTVRMLTPKDRDYPGA